MHYQQGGEKYPIHVPKGSFASRKEKFGRNAFVQRSLHSCIWEIIFA
jgi:hypothetical protein